MRKVLCVEPVIFIYIFAFSLTTPLVQQFIYRRLWEQEYNSTFVSDSNVSHCEQNKSSPAYIKQKAKLTVSCQQKRWSFSISLSSLTSCVESRNSAVTGYGLDLRGALINQKVYLLFWGCCFLNVVCCFVFFSEAVHCSGTLSGHMISVSNMGIAKGTYFQKRCNSSILVNNNWQLMDLIFGVVSGLAGLSSGYFLRGIGFAWTFVIASLLHVINIIYIVFFLEDTASVSQFQHEAPVSWKELLRETFSGVYLLFKTAPYKKRILIIVLLFTFMTYLFTLLGGSSLFTLYELDEPLCWNEVYIGYGAAAFTSVSLTSFLGVYLFSKCLKDIYIVFIGMFSYIGGMIMAAFAKTTLLMFL
ncbi:S46A3 protein, partial [Horornis vulcanius]|nr:S46A3 protein [Horornis vulcanius]